MKSFTIILLIYLTLVNVETDGSNSIINYKKQNSTFNSNNNNNNSRTLSTNFYNNLNTSIVGNTSSSTTHRDRRDTNFALDPSEIARQNQITQQILSNYLERRLFPFRSVNQKIPTIAEILPKPKPPTVRPKARAFAHSSGSYKRGASKQPKQRRTYGNGYKNRNSLLQRNKQKTTQKPYFEDDYDEVETERSINNNSSFNTENNDNNDDTASVNDDFIDDVIVENVEDEFVEEVEPKTLAKQSQNYQQLQRHHYRYLEDNDDLDTDNQESLQSVESEQHDQYYSSNDNSGNIFLTDPKENEIDSGESFKSSKLRNDNF